MTGTIDIHAFRPGSGGAGVPERGLARLLAAYHLATEAEKGVAVASVDDLPHRYRAEILDPADAFRDDLVLMARLGGTFTGCLVVTAPVDGRSELKRLWTEPTVRGRGVASGLVAHALAEAPGAGIDRVGLSVWAWREGAVALYERLGFAVVPSWDDRGRLICMERPVHRGDGA
ncbi:GNAT family N-acetyltransferase [Streptomyces fructofermentans]|uniref:N-acetyltransferase domain-containing protein n=1 Tax=Streptomyces fructofermentans TaxID=152141 RepID=A0A918KQY9_9ACTN|nr:GNAT family N-acetyltransferase [Streptomyces fructofermentans]GGX70152.1 hypothetical protein GCM10010515_42290 [Streptomyces fructofermentans]